MTDYIQPDFNAMALVTTNVQRDFLKRHPFEIEGTSEALPQMRLLVKAFRDAGIVHMVRLYKRDRSNADLCRRQVVEDGASMVRPDTLGSELASALLPTADVKLEPELVLSGLPQVLGEKECVFYKPR